MELLLIIVLAGVIVWQGRRIGALSRRVGELERRLSEYGAESLWAPPAPTPTSKPAAAPVEARGEPPPAEEPLVLDQPLPPDDREPLLLDQPLPPDQQEPLLLDTPLPEVSNDDTPAPPAPARAEPQRIFERLTRARAKPDRKFEDWLAQNGLAWLAAGAAALGAIFLVSFAAQQNWFTPQVQLASALLLGFGLLGASEWARRVSLRKPPGHPLIAALLAGAGVVALYATSWAAHGLYGFIGYGAAAALLTLCALILIGLSLLHGQALGVLAIAAALLAPALADAPLWASAALMLYIAAIGATGFALAAWRRWSWVAVATLLGLYFWFAAALAIDDIGRALALLSLAALGGVSLAYRKPIAGETGGRLSWTQLHAHGPAVAITVSSVLVFCAWFIIAPMPNASVAGPAWVGAMFVALAAAAVRARVAVPVTLIVAIIMLVLSFAWHARTRFLFGPLGSEFYPFILFASLLVVTATLGANPHRRWRTPTAATGAIGAAVLIVLASFSRADWHALQAWAPLFVGAVALFAAAWHVSRQGEAPGAQRALDFWVGAGAALVLLGVESAFPPESRVAHAGAALLFASAFAWQGWRALRFAALTAAALTIAHALSPSLSGAALTGEIPLWGALVLLGVAAALLFGAAYFATAEPRSPFGEALSGAGVIVVLIGVFLALRYLAAGGAGVAFDPFSEASLRALTLIAAGHIVLPRAGQELGLIGRWRGHVLMGLGLGYVLLFPGYAINPWWGAPAARVLGPPVFDTLFIALAAPAALAFAAAWRLYGVQRLAARLYAASGGVLALIWAVLLVRRVAHGAAMANATVGLLEGAIYALLFLAAALGVALAARMRAAKAAEAPFTQDLLSVMRGGAWAGLAAAALILLIARHPAWGGQIAGATNALETGLAVLAQFAAMTLALVLGRALSTTRETSPVRFAAASAAVLFAWSFGHAAIRWLYHQGGMDDDATLIGLEGFVHAVWPLAFVLGGAEITARAPGRDTVRAYLHDLDALWSAAVWPALGFAALGMWLLFNPWWGETPAAMTSPLSAFAALALLLLAAWLSATSPRVAHIRQPDWFMRVATFAALAHGLVAATIAVRWLHHGAAMSTARAGEIELWIYSAVWALFGAGAFAVGLHRNNAVIRWCGLGLLLLTTVYVYFLTFTQLTGVIRAVTAIGLAAVLFLVAWLARTYSPARGDDLTNVTPGARRERRHGRR